MGNKFKVVRLLPRTYQRLLLRFFVKPVDRTPKSQGTGSQKDKAGDHPALLQVSIVFSTMYQYFNYYRCE